METSRRCTDCTFAIVLAAMWATVGLCIFPEYLVYGGWTTDATVYVTSFLSLCLCAICLTRAQNWVFVTLCLVMVVDGLFLFGYAWYDRMTGGDDGDVSFILWVVVLLLFVVLCGLYVIKVQDERQESFRV